MLSSVLFLGLLILNFVISWYNSVTVGRMWSESKVIGGAFRVYSVAVYIMAVTGFTMVYGNVLLLILPSVIPLIPELSWIPVDGLRSLTSDMLYVLIITFIVPSGLILWYGSIVNFVRKRTLTNGLAAGWNTYAQIRNTLHAAKNMPGALGRIAEALFGKKSKEKDGGAIIMFAVLIIILAVLGGWFTASAIMKKADREYDGLAELDPNMKVFR